MRDEIELLKAFRADTPAPTAEAWTRAEEAIETGRHQARGRPVSRLLSGFPGVPALRLPRWRVLTALSAAFALAAAVLFAVTLAAGTTASQGKTTGPSASAGGTPTWTLAGYLEPVGWQLDTHGPVPGAMTCPTATTCYVQGRTTGLHVSTDGARTGLYVSTDGARTWRAIRLPSGLAFTTALECQTSATCEAGAMEHGEPAFTVTKDGGRTWTTRPLPAAAGELMGLSCLSTTVCRALAVAPGQRFPVHEHLVTTDDGVHFTTTAFPFPAADRILTLTCPTASRCVATGLGPVSGRFRTGAVLLSDDGGATWRPGTLPGGVQLRGQPVTCIGDEHCLTLGTVIPAQGSLYDELLVSADGGATWTERPLDAKFPTPVIQDLACPTASTCYVTGSDDVAEHFDNGTATSASSSFAAVTKDAGLTWQAIGLPEPASLPRFEPPDVYMSIASLQCPKAGICIALTDGATGSKYAAIYRTAP
jgi:photosystem II stability/assembly factor-like uncharacterized protein